MIVFGVGALVRLFLHTYDGGAPGPVPAPAVTAPAPQASAAAGADDALAPSFQAGILALTGIRSRGGTAGPETCAAAWGDLSPQKRAGLDEDTFLSVCTAPVDFVQ